MFSFMDGGSGELEGRADELEQAVDILTGRDDEQESADAVLGDKTTSVGGAVMASFSYIQLRAK